MSITTTLQRQQKVIKHLSLMIAQKRRAVTVAEHDESVGDRDRLEDQLKKDKEHIQSLVRLRCDLENLFGEW